MERITFDKYFAPIIPYVPDMLISSEAFDEIKKSASILPSELVNFTFGFECELGNENPDADFLVSYNTQIGKRDALANISLDKELKENKVWKGILEVNNRWNDKNDFIYHRLDFLWLEFDTKTKNYFVPGIFFGPLIYSDSKFSRKEQFIIICEKVFAIFGIDKPGKSVLTLMNNLPDDVHIFQIGILPARNVPFQRFCITKLNSDELEKLLYVVEYPYIDKAVELFNWLSDFSDKIEVDIDLGDEIGEKIGYECYIESENIEKWQKFLDFLVDEKMCTKEKCEAILNYPGVSDSDTDRDIWPENLLDALSVMNSWKQSIFKRSIHHIKVVFEPGKPLQAKVYLAVNHYWRR